jgi:hypothetical protein
MQAQAFAPLLTEKDPAESTEGGLDPLGTDPLADALARRLVPGVRERMRHPRFLTAIAVSLEVCREFDDDSVAADGVSEPWQVFEWYMVEGLVRTMESDDRLGLPGSLKARSAKAAGVPLSAKRYLKSPAVFGFHGVYRQLARSLGIEEGGRLGETGLQLLSRWGKEQGLGEVCGTVDGPAPAIRLLRDAVQDGLEKAGTSRSAAWAGWEFFSKHLAPYATGRDEARFLAASLLSDPKGFRREVIEFLVSPDGIRTWKEHDSEREFHQALRKTASDGLRPLLDGIDAYETFSRLCEDAFRDCLRELAHRGGTKTSPTVLANIEAVKIASERIPESFSDVMARLEPLNEASRFCDAFASLRDRGSPSNWAERLFEHHRQIQKQKPPNGKSPWFERFDDGSLIIRPEYRDAEAGTHDGGYVHLYRTRSLLQFASDLGMIKS